MAIVPVIEPSEARYASVGANMASSGNFMEPQFVFQGKRLIFEGKPPLFFQCSGWCCRFLGKSEFAVRLPALLSGALILLCLYWCCRKLRNRGEAFLAVTLCLGTPAFYLFAGLCMTDLMLAGSISIAVMGYMLFSAAEDSGGRRTGSLLFFASLGVGMIVKGPVALVLAGMPVFFFLLINKRWKELKNHSWAWGILLFLLIALPWYLMMTLRNPDFLEYFFINENFKRFLFKEYGDRYGAGRESFRGMAFLFFLLANFPFVFFGFFLALRKGFGKIREKLREVLADPLTGLALLAVVTNTLFWCLTSRVLLTYLLPTIPMCALLVAELIFRSGKESEILSRTRRVFWISASFIALTVAVLVWGAFFGERFFDKLPGPVMKKALKHRELEKYKFYFARNTPYSAEFYLGDLIRNHPKEDRRESFLNSASCVLFITRNDFRKLRQSPGTLPGRKKLFTCGVWEVFAPLEPSPGKNKP